MDKVTIMIGGCLIAASALALLAVAALDLAGGRPAYGGGGDMETEEEEGGPQAFDPAAHRTEDGWVVEAPPPATWRTPGWLRLYWRPSSHGPGQGFEAKLYEVAMVVNAPRDYATFSDGRTKVDVLASATACFDGIRHLHMPYWHYADTDLLAWLAGRLGQLEDLHCPDSGPATAAALRTSWATCPLCRTPVASDQPHVSHAGAAYHTTCFARRDK